MTISRVNKSQVKILFLGCPNQKLLTYLDFIILLILSTISIQALTQTGLFQNANRAKLETKRSQIKEWLSLNLMEVQTTNYDKTDSEILEIARGKAEKSEELKK